MRLERGAGIVINDVLAAGTVDRVPFLARSSLAPRRCAGTGNDGRSLPITGQGRVRFRGLDRGSGNMDFGRSESSVSSPDINDQSDLRQWSPCSAHHGHALGQSDDGIDPCVASHC
jgi:hypothetical protein